MMAKGRCSAIKRRRGDGEGAGAELRASFMVCDRFFQKKLKKHGQRINFLVCVCVCVWIMVAWLRALGAALLCKGVNVVAFSGQWSWDETIVS